MKYKIAVCDDQTPHRELVCRLVSDWAEQHGYLTEIRSYCEAAPFLFDYGREKDYDLLLLDIEMPGISGVELARAVRRDNSAVQIVFVTGYDDYFSDGFDVSALHYLLKPIHADKLFPVLDRAAANLAVGQRSVLLSTAEAEIKVPLSDILWIEAENVYVLVHTVKEVYRCRMSLSRLLEQLDDTFLQVHRSYAVGLRHIQKITRTDITLAGGAVVPMRRGMYDAVHAALIKYL